MKRFQLAACALGLLAVLGQGPVDARPRHHPVVHSSDYVGDEGYYTNINGHSVHRPAHRARRLAGATAKCGEGTWSFSENHRGTCSHHGGVSSWL